MTVYIQAAADFTCLPIEDESGDALHAAIFIDDAGCELRLDAGADFQSRLLTWLIADSGSYFCVSQKNHSHPKHSHQNSDVGNLERFQRQFGEFSSHFRFHGFSFH